MLYHGCRVVLSETAEELWVVHEEVLTVDRKSTDVSLDAGPASRLHCDEVVRSKTAKENPQHTDLLVTISADSKMPFVPQLHARLTAVT